MHIHILQYIELKDYGYLAHFHYIAGFHLQALHSSLLYCVSAGSLKYCFEAVYLTYLLQWNVEMHMYFTNSYINFIVITP